MSEVKTELKKLEEGEVHVAKADEVVITEHHTLADIVRYAVECSSVGEIKYLIDEIAAGPKGKEEQVLEELSDHKIQIIDLWDEFAGHLDKRIENHDDSKKKSPELEALSLIKDMKYGTPEYDKVCESEGIQHHYKVNEHHPEHFENKADDMTLFDINEYFLDCYEAATRRSGRLPDFKRQQKRHNLSDQMVKVLNNTVKEMAQLIADSE